MAVNPSVQSQLLDAAVAALAKTGYPAYRTRMSAFPPAQLPAFNVLPDEGEPVYENAVGGSVTWRFRWKVRMMGAAVDEVDKAIDPLFVSGSQQILSDPTLGGLCWITRYAGQKWEREGEGQYDQCALVITFESEFATLRGDPSVSVP